MLGAFGDRFAYCAAGGLVCHGTELPLVFQTARLVLASEGVPATGTGSAMPTPEEDMLADQMNSLWTRFVSASQREGENFMGSAWPSYTATRKALAFAATGAVKHTHVDVMQDTCEFWNGVGYNVES